MPHLFRRTALWAVVACCAILPPAHAVISGIAVPDNQSGLDAVGILLTEPASGNNSCGGFVSGTCTLIGTDMVIMARHSLAAPGAALPLDGSGLHRVRFRRGVTGGVSNHFTSDCTAPFQEIEIAAYLAAAGPGLDIVIGRLARPPVGITPIPADPSFTPAGRAPFTLCGWGFDGLCIQTGDAWTLRTRAAALPLNPNASACCFEYNQAVFSGAGCVSAAAAAQWAIGNMHDSGAPILAERTINGVRQLAVVGVVSATNLATSIASWNRSGSRPVLPLPIAPPVCPADINNSGTLSVQDVFDFLSNYFNTGSTLGDFNGSGTVTVEDVFAFMQAFLAGC